MSLARCCALVCLALAGPAPVGAAAAAPQGWDGWPVFVWRQDWGDERAPAELFGPYSGINIEGAEEAAWARERGYDFYVGHAPGRNALHLERSDEAWAERWQRWYDTRDEELLVRTPCLHDEETRQELFARLERSLGARDGDCGLGISLGDEVGLTPHGSPSDICRSPETEAAWERWCGERGLEPGRAPLTDEVRLALLEGDTSGLGRWLARRRFHHDELVGLLGELAAAARRLSPGSPVGLLGLAGRTAFGGLSLEAILPHLDFAEPYEFGRALDQALTLRAPEQRILRTVFVAGGEDAPADAAWQAWELWARGGDGLVIWSDRLLGQRPEVHARLARAVAEVRELERELPDFRPRPRGFAVVYDPDSQAYSWLRDALHDGPTWPKRFSSYQEERGTAERVQRSWVTLLQDAGFAPGLLPLESVGAVTVERFGVLVLPHLGVVDAAELAGLTSYLEAGGELWVDGPLGELDGRGRMRPRPLSEALREGWAEQLAPPPAGLEEYLNRRLGPDDARCELLRSRVRKAAARAGIAQPPFELRTSEAAPPWLRLWMEVDGSYVGAAIPNLRSSDERREALEDRELRVVVPDGWTVEVLHPRPGIEEPAGALEESQETAPWLRLPAGDALVVRLNRG